MVKLVALIAVHNRLSFTQRCVQSIRAAAQGISYRIVVVDDGSTDGTKEWLEEQTDLDRVVGDGNLWFGGATDLGIRHVLVSYTGASAVLILNNDTFIRPDGLNILFRNIDVETVAAAAYWVEDRGLTASAGFIWSNLRGLSDVVTRPEWVNAKARGDAFILVDAVSTTMTLYPMALLKRVRLPSVTLHPHNRYDAVFSARLRAAGARFLCSVECIADHVHGPMAARPTARTLGVCEFLDSSFRKPITIWYLWGILAAEWETAPNFTQRLWSVGRRLIRFSIQLTGTGLNSLGASFLYNLIKSNK